MVVKHGQEVLLLAVKASSMQLVMVLQVSNIVHAGLTPSSTCAMLLKQQSWLQSRPFGVALLVAGWDNGSAVLFHTDPSGTFYRCEAMAIGSGSEGAQTALKEGFRADLSLAEAEVLALSTLKQVMEEKVGTHSLQTASFCHLDCIASQACTSNKRRSRASFASAGVQQ